MVFDIVFIYTALAVGIYYFYTLLKNVNGWYYTFKYSSEKSILPPGDMGWPFFGNMLYLLKCMNSGNLDPFANYFITKFGAGGLYKAFMFGRPAIVVTTPELCRKILMDDENFGVGFPDYLFNLLGQEIGGGYTDHDKLLRKVAAGPIRTHPSLSHYFDAVNEIVKGSFEKWVAMEEPIELLSAMRRPAFEVLMRVLIGGEQVSREILDFVFVENQFRFRGLKALAINLPGFIYHRGIKARIAVANILQDIINERKALNAKNVARSKHNMLDMMLIAQEADAEITDKEIITWLLSYTFGGYEIVGLSASKVIMHLLEHPEFLQKAKEEQEEIVKRRSSPNAGLSFEEIAQMKYLSKVFLETLRFGSTETIFFRDARNTVKLNGYTIPKGWKVLTMSGNWYMDSNNYVNPKEFDPSRWDDVEIKPTAFLPFGIGPRMCTGALLATFEVQVILHYFLLNHSLEQITHDSKPECRLVRFKKLSA